MTGTQLQAGGRREMMLADKLGYTSEAGWIDATEFDYVSNHWHVLLQARNEMAVCPSSYDLEQLSVLFNGGSGSFLD